DLLEARQYIVFSLDVLARARDYFSLCVGRCRGDRPFRAKRHERRELRWGRRSGYAEVGRMIERGKMAMFEGFERHTIETEDADIASFVGGSEPPLLLLRG